MTKQSPHLNSAVVRAFLLASMLHFAVSPAMAQDAAAGAAPMNADSSRSIDFSKADLNKDGYIDRTEATSPELLDLLRTADTNGDGRVSTVEFGLSMEKKAPMK